MKKKIIKKARKVYRKTKVIVRGNTYRSFIELLCSTRDLMIILGIIALLAKCCF